MGAQLLGKSDVFTLIFMRTKGRNCSRARNRIGTRNQKYKHLHGILHHPPKGEFVSTTKVDNLLYNTKRNMYVHLMEGMCYTFTLPLLSDFIYHC